MSLKVSFLIGAALAGLLMLATTSLPTQSDMGMANQQPYVREAYVAIIDSN